MVAVLVDLPRLHAPGPHRGLGRRLRPRRDRRLGEQRPARHHAPPETSRTEPSLTLTAPVIADLEWVIAYWPDLTEARLPGTARPWRQPELSPEQRAERDHAARIERDERGAWALGESPAPVDVGVLDLLASLLMDADIVHEMVAQAAGVERLDPPTTAFADARPYLAFAAEHLMDV